MTLHYTSSRLACLATTLADCWNQSYGGTPWRFFKFEYCVHVELVVFSDFFIITNSCNRCIQTFGDLIQVIRRVVNKIFQRPGDWKSQITTTTRFWNRMFTSSACALGSPRGFDQRGSKGKISRGTWTCFTERGNNEMLMLLVGKGLPADVLNREQIRKNCGNKATQGNFGREQGSPHSPRRPSEGG